MADGKNLWAVPLLLDDAEVITIKDEPLNVSEYSVTVLDSSTDNTDCSEWLSLSNFDLALNQATAVEVATVVEVEEEGAERQQVAAPPALEFPPRFVVATTGLDHPHPRQATKGVECPVCGSCFKMRCHMVMHMRTAHPSAVAELNLPYSRTTEKKKKKKQRLHSQWSDSAAILSRRRRIVRRLAAAAATLPGPSGTPKKPDQKPAAKPQPKPQPKGLTRFQQPQGSLEPLSKLDNPELPPPKFKCSQCSFSTGYKVNLVVHRQQAHRKQLRCPKCSYVTRSPTNLLAHSRLHAKASKGGKKGAVPALRCRWCGSLFGTMGSLVNHENVHRRAGEQQALAEDAPAAESSAPGAGAATAPAAPSGRPQWRVHECGQCEAVFKYRGSLLRHQLIQHCAKGGTPVPKVKVKEPGRKSSTPAGTPKGEDAKKVYGCEGCGAKFGNQLSLIRHKAAHTRHGTWPANKRPVTPKKGVSAACAIPSGGSSSASDRPSTSQSNGKPCQCDMLSCEACMARLLEDAGNLNGGDIEFESSPLPYPCHMCPSEFASLEELSEHIKEHVVVFP